MNGEFVGTQNISQIILYSPIYITSYPFAQYIFYKRHWDDEGLIECVNRMFVPINAVTLIVIEK